MKKKKIIGLISLFMCVCLVGVGFAAWVITGDASANSEGNLQVETVTDKRLAIDKVALTNNSIVFGAPETINDSGKWFQATGVAKEVLSTTLTFSITNNDQCTGVDFTIAPASEDDEKKYQAAVDAKLIESPAAMNDGAHLNKSDDGNYTITFTWAWGKEFSLDGASKGENPYTFYNRLTSAGTDIANARTPKTLLTNADYALAALGTTINSGLAALNEVGFVITITAKSTANAV